MTEVSSGLVAILVLVAASTAEAKDGKAEEAGPGRLVAAERMQVAIDSTTRIIGNDGGATVRLRGGVRHASGTPILTVTVAGHTLPVSIGRRWTAHVPIADLRRWVPHARAVAVRVVATDDRGRSAVADARVRLPTGALGQRTSAPILLAKR